MVHRVITPDSFRFETQTTASAEDIDRQQYGDVLGLHGSTQVNVPNWAKSTIETRNLNWIEAGGMGEFNGLSRLMSERFRAIAPKCGENCCMIAEVQVFDACPDGVILELTCAGDCSAEEQAITQEKLCAENHAKAQIAFAKQARDSRSAQLDVEHAQKKLRSAEEALRGHI